MKKYVLIVVFLCYLFSAASAQTNPIILTGLNGTPITETKYTNIEGDPYLYNSWKFGDVKFKDGSIFKNIQLKYNLISDELVFKGEDGQEMLFLQPVAEFTLFPSGESFINGFKGSKNFTEKTYLQQLNYGKTIVYKRTIKNIVERREYNSATSTQTFVQNVLYFYSTKDIALALFKKEKKSLLVLLADKQKEVEAYISSNNLNVKDDKDLAAILTFYSAL